jgi:hypothetical protein
MFEFYLQINEKEVGPYQRAQVQQLLEEGKITGETPARHKDSLSWGTVAEVLVPSSVRAADSVPVASSGQNPKKKRMSGCLVAAILLALLLPCCWCGLGPIGPGIKKAKESSALQQTHAIILAMFEYANDHNGAYPDGKSSTEVFQKLIDGNYISDPTVFYLSSMTGKTKAVGNKLTADNVSFDVTSGVDADSSEDVPVVFSSGYTVTYAPDAVATRDPNSITPFSGIAEAYKNNSARFTIAATDGSIPAFVPATFVAGSETYRQLRP